MAWIFITYFPASVLEGNINYIQSALYSVTILDDVQPEVLSSDDRREEDDYAILFSDDRREEEN